MTAQAAAALGAFLGAFLGSFVEFIEALTVVLAIGSVRGWRDTLAGGGAALLLLAVAVAVAGPSLAGLFATKLQLAVGLLVLLFGMRWLRKAVQRRAGLRKLHDEAAAYVAARGRLLAAGAAPGFDRLAAGGAFNIVLLEGSEVVFIVAAIGARPGLAVPAAAGALAALACVVALGLIFHRPIAAIPENALKFAVGVLLCGFGTFWTGEGLGAEWPGGDLALPLLAALWATVALGVGALARQTARKRAA